MDPVYLYVASTIAIAIAIVFVQINRSLRAYKREDVQSKEQHTLQWVHERTAHILRWIRCTAPCIYRGPPANRVEVKDLGFARMPMEVYVCTHPAHEAKPWTTQVDCLKCLHYDACRNVATVNEEVQWTQFS